MSAFPVVMQILSALKGNAQQQPQQKPQGSSVANQAAQAATATTNTSAPVGVNNTDPWAEMMQKNQNAMQSGAMQRMTDGRSMQYPAPNYMAGKDLTAQ